MKISEDIYIAGGYYVDFDSLGQLRVFGPNNHLYLGLVDVPRHKIRIDEVRSGGDGYEARIGYEKGLREENKDVTAKRNGPRNPNRNRPTNEELARVEIKGAFTVGKVNLYLPVMGDVRTLRDITKDFTNELRQFLKMRESQHTLHGEAQPTRVDCDTKANRLTFRRDYGEHYYQTSFSFPSYVRLNAIDTPYKGYHLSLRTKSKSGEVPFVLLVETDDVSMYDESCVLLGMEVVDFSVFGKNAERVRRFLERTKIEVEHMLCWGKTSGDRFGTVFPRDWMESAALGIGDIPPVGIDYILKKSLAHVNEEGEGWHEDVVGDYKYKHQAAGRDLFDRKMIDIEPWYFISLRWVTEKFWEDKESVDALRRAAKYILRRARQQEYITFESLPEGEEMPSWQQSFGLERGYYAKGDWRDSEWAYKHIHPIIAPFSVSAVFYPEALSTMLKFSDKLEVDKGEVEKLEEVWRHKKEAYRFEDYNGTTGFALTLYDSWKQLRVHHLDEAYLYYLSENYTKAEALGFARRMLDFEYFYTESGPLIVARNNEMGYTDEEYHGLVVWTKQAAFAVAGMARALEVKKEELSETEKELLRKAALTTAQNLICAYCCLDSIPELHKDINGNAVEWGGGAGSSVQLWSAVGARRIFREYERLVKSMPRTVRRHVGLVRG